jgi:hypothetical protein
MTKETGGPAFPVVQDAAPGLHSGGVEAWGLTIRDYFAANVLQGIWANPKANADYLKNHAAADCYMAADAMIKARK